MPGAARPGHGTAHPIGGEQSNTSVVVGGTHVLKVLRRLQPGPNPEVEVGRHLAAAAAAGHHVPVAPLAGWYDLHEGDTTTTLGVLHELVPGALDAWALVLSALAGGPDGLLARLHHLGAAVATLHDALALPGEEPDAFGAAPLAADRVRSVADAVAADEPDAAPLAQRLAGALADDLGASIRHHGDLHLGQVVLGPDGMGDPRLRGRTGVARGRPPPPPLAAARRGRHAPLAGLRRRHAPAQPGSAPQPRLGARRPAAFLDGYLATVNPALLPTSAAATSTLLHLFELEKVVYEIGYERAHRPDWVDVPLEGLRLLLAEDPA